MGFCKDDLTRATFISFCRCPVEHKRGRIRRVKNWQTALTILAALFVSLALADDFKTINGKEYKNATVSRVEPDGILLKSSSGISKVYFTELPKKVQERFHYDREKAAAYSAGQNAATQKNNAQLAKEYAGVQWTTEQQQSIQALRANLQLLQNAKEDLQREIREKEKLPSRLSGHSDLYRPRTHSYTYTYSYDNPARADLPDLKERLFNVTQEIGRLTKQLQQLEHGY